MKKGTPGHPKTKALARKLRVPLPMAVGILELMWHFAGEYAPAGDIGRFEDDAIADAVGWPQEREVTELITALTADGSRWLDKHPDHRLIVHDWSEHCDNGVHVELARGRMTFADGSLPSPPRDRLKSSERDQIDAWLSSLSSNSPVPNLDQPEDGPGKVQDGPGAGDGSLSLSLSPASPKPSPAGPAPASARTAIDDGFPEFRSIAEQSGMHASEPDWDEARRFEWKKLDYEQKQAAAEGLRERAGTDDFALTSLPKNYLAKRMWQRRIRSPASTRPPAKPAPRATVQPSPDPALTWANGSPARCGECFDSGFLDPERKKPCACTAVPAGGGKP